MRPGLQIAIGLLLLPAGCDGTFTVDPHAIESIRVEPAELTLEVVNGIVVAQPFQAIGLRYDGTSVPLVDGVSWSVAGDDAGTLGTDGLYTPSGARGGHVTVAASLGGAVASARLTVRLDVIDEQASIGDAAKHGLRAALDGLPVRAAGYDPDILWAYPYHQTVFPRGLAAPLLMWTGATASDDVYAVRLSTPTYQVETFAHAPAPSRLAVAHWAELTAAAEGSIDVAVAHWAAGVATPIVHHTWIIAPAELPGSIWYWTLGSKSRIQRLHLGDDAAEDPFADYAVDGTPRGCPKCHTLSADGRRMIMTVDNHFDSASYDVVNRRTDFYGYPGEGQWLGVGLSARGEVLVQSWAPIRGPAVDMWTHQDGAFDAVSGARIAGSGLDGLRMWMPGFSADDQLLVYVREVPGAHDCPTASAACIDGLRAFDWDPVARHASNDRVLVAQGDDPALAVLQYPAPSPDHRLVVYQRGAKLGSFDPYVEPAQPVAGDLYAVTVATPGSEARLSRLGGDDYPFAAGERDRHFDYDPAFAPVVAGGYLWVVFSSRRSYGNVLSGEAFIPNQGNGVKQLWIAAIDLDAPPGADPSHPAFWLPGQDLSETDPTVINMRGRWALDPQ